MYITTAVHYVNDDPHIGHMYENIAADVIARHRRRMGDDVHFLTGTDEHGQKIERAAAKEGVLPIELADRVVTRTSNSSAASRNTVPATSTTASTPAGYCQNEETSSPRTRSKLSACGGRRSFMPAIRVPAEWSKRRR